MGFIVVFDGLVIVKEFLFFILGRLMVSVIGFCFRLNGWGVLDNRLVLARIRVLGYIFLLFGLRIVIFEKFLFNL